MWCRQHIYRHVMQTAYIQTCDADSIYRHVVQTNTDSIVTGHRHRPAQMTPSQINAHDIATD